MVKTMEIDKNTLLLWTKFRDYHFYESEHYYTYKGERVGTSVTQFVGSKSQPFDKEKMSQRVAEKEGCTQQEILNRWQKGADISCVLGTLFHLRSELYAAGKTFDIDYSEAEKLNIKKPVQERLEKLMPMQDEFFKSIHGRLLPLKTEFTVGIDKYIAGNIDLLAWNEKDQEMQIWDYKTNKEIKMKNDFGKKMLDEFSDLDDCEFCHYSVQLNIYKEIIERNLGIKIGKCFLAYFNEKNEHWQPIQCMDVQDKVKIALDNLCK